MANNKTSEEVGGEETNDHSLLIKPINLGTTGIQHVLRSIQNGTPEVRNLLMNECELIYECKVCRSLHRSLANFIAHKRVYCTKHCCETMLLFDNKDIENETMVVQPESPGSGTNHEDDSFCDANHHMAEVGFCNTNHKAGLAEDEDGGTQDVIKVVTPTILQPLQNVIQKEKRFKTNTSEDSVGEGSYSKTTRFYDKCLKHLENRDLNKMSTVLHLEPISENHNAVLQKVQNPDVAAEISLVEEGEEVEEEEGEEEEEKEEEESCNQGSVGDQNSEPQKSADANKGIKKSTQPVSICSCFMCGASFTSVKTMTFHLKSIHAKRRVYFPCPFCNAMFSQLWGVVRHLLTIHKKTKEQVNKLRSKIRQKALQKAAADKDSGDEAEVVSKPRDVKGMATPPSPHASSSVSPMVRLSKDLDVIKCNQCDTIFTQKEALDAHKKICNTSGSHDKKASMEHRDKRNGLERSSDTIQTRPKRIVKKKESKDFVSSTHLNIRTNMVSKGENVKRAPPTIEKKILAIINIKKLQCVQCNRTFTTLSNLRRHAATHVGWNRYKCKYCDYQSYSRSECRNHVKRVHITKRQLHSQVDKFVVDLPTEDEEEEDGDSNAMEIEDNSEKDVGEQSASPDSSPNKKSISKPEELRKTASPSSTSSLQVCKSTKPLDKPESNNEITHAIRQKSPEPIVTLVPVVVSRPQENYSSEKTSADSSLTASSGSGKSVAASPGKRPPACNTTNFNISTRLSPRTFDTSPYRRCDASDALPTLVTRSGAYIKSNFISQTIKQEPADTSTEILTGETAKQSGRFAANINASSTNNNCGGEDDEDDDMTSEYASKDNLGNNYPVRYPHHGDHNYSAEFVIKDDLLVSIQN